MDIMNLNFAINAEKLGIDNKTTKRLFEDALCKDELSELDFNSFSLPKNAPNEMPRMIGTLGNHSGSVTIQITNISASATFNFTSSMQSEVTECMQTADAINKKLYDAFKLNTSKITFLGTIINYKKNDIMNDYLKFINDKFFTMSSKNNLFSIENKFALKLKDAYFVNVSLGAIRERKIAQKSEDFSKILGITVDINNRYQWDFRGELSKDNDYDFINNLHKEIVTNRLNTLLQNKEFDLDE